MRKLLPAIILVLIAAAGGGYYYQWNNKAVKFQTAIEEAIANINKDQKYISYESISKSGFPSQVRVTVSKPVITLPVSEFFKKLENMEERAASAPPNPFVGFVKQNWTETYRSDGNLVFGSNMTGDHLSFTMDGNISGESKIGDAPPLEIESTTNSPFKCDLQFNNTGGAFSSMKDEFAKAKDNPEALFALFKAFECGHEGGSTKKKGAANAFSMSGPVRVLVAKDSSGAEDSFQFVLKAKDTKLTAEMDEIMKHYFSAFDTTNPIYAAYVKPYEKLSIYGTQNLDIDLSFRKSKDFGTGEAGSIVLDTKSLLFTSDIMKFDYDVDFTMELAKDKTAVTGKLTGVSSVTEAYDTLMRGQYEGMIDMLATIPVRPGEDAVIQDALKALTPEQRTKLVADVAPRYSSFGEMKTDIRFGFSANGNVMQNPFVASSLKVDAFDFTTTPYGMKSNGAFEMATPMQPVGKYAIELINSPQMIDDVVAYVKRIQGAVAQFDAKAADKITVPENLVAGIKHFLYELADPKTPTYKYTIVSEQGGNITISGKPMMEVMQLYDNDIAGQIPASGGAGSNPYPAPQETEPAADEETGGE